MDDASHSAPLNEQEVLLGKQETHSSQQEAHLSEQETHSSQQQAHSSEQEAHLSEQETLLSEREALSSQQQAHLSEREALLSEREALSSQRVELGENDRPTRARGAREIAARAALRPLGPSERPAALWAAIAVAAALALGVLASVATVHDLAHRGGSLPGGLFLAAVLSMLAWGMYRRRHWAVLAFEALLAFQMIVTSLALIVAETLLAAALCALSIGLSGWLFWRLVRVMGRIQAGELQSPGSERARGAGEQETDEALR
jgi:hypothetical protein